MWHGLARFTRVVPTILWFVVGIILVVQVFLLLHELGHALAALSVGGAVVGFDARLMSPRPHVSYQFPDVTAGQRAFVSAAGTLLPMLAWGAAILALPRRLPPHLALLRFGASAGVLAGLLPWIVFPWPAFQGLAPNDDTVRFMHQSGWPPALVVALAAAVLGSGIALFWWRSGGRGTFPALRAITAVEIPRRTVTLAVTTLFALVLTTIVVDAWLLPGAAQQGEGVVLPEAAAIADVTLAGGSIEAELATGVSDDGRFALVIGYEGVEGGPFGLVLIDAEGTERSLGSFGEGTTMGVARSRPRLAVAEGPWTVRLWAQQTVGRFRLWIDDESVAWEGP